MKQAHIELDLPSFYQSQHLLYQMLVTLQANLAILALSFIVAQGTSIDIVHQSVFISIIVFILLNFINYHRDCHQFTNRQLCMHPVPIITLILGGIIVFQIPNYSIMIAGVGVLDMLRNVYTAKTKKFKNCADQFIVSFAQLALSLALLSIEKVINFNLNYIFMLLFLLGVFELIFSNLLLISSFKNSRQRYNEVFMSKQRFLLFFCQNFAAFFSLTTLLLWNLIDRKWLIPCYKFACFCNLLCVAPLLLFFQQILLITTMPKFESDQTIFRHSSRRFTENNGTKRGDNDYQKQIDCLLCQDKAVNIMMPCGHLTTCQKCYTKNALKGFYYCQLCLNRSVRKVTLRPIQKTGYLRRWFIEKKLEKNEFLVN